MIQKTLHEESGWGHDGEKVRGHPDKKVTDSFDRKLYN